MNISAKSKSNQFLFNMQAERKPFCRPRDTVDHEQKSAILNFPSWNCNLTFCALLWMILQYIFVAKTLDAWVRFYTLRATEFSTKISMRALNFHLFLTFPEYLTRNNCLFCVEVGALHVFNVKHWQLINYYIFPK